MTSLLITNAHVVNEGQIQQLDVFVANGRIEKVGADLSSLAADRVIDAQGKHLLPGMIDDQVHFREPGLTHKGEIATESAAAVAGGITSYFEMPNVNPLTINSAALEDKYERATRKSLANFAFYLGASNDNLEDIKSLDPKAACGIKVFMGASTGNMLVDKPEILEGIFANAPTIVVTHCEDTPMITANEEKYRQQYGEDVPMSCHPLIRSEEACYKSSSMAVSLAKQFNTRLHILHLTTEKELELLQAGDMKNKRITAEACVHHLFFSEEDYETKGALIKCNPAVKKASDRAALLQAVNNDLIDVVATDHAPHTWDEKQNPYFKAPSGLPLVQHALISMLEHYHSGIFSLETIVQKVSHHVAASFQI
ncbi:MAG: dihydroorotase, partial [Pseudomonadales bacterium]|nr:dihydroorotase [Pseudomonadales bacterium]